MTKKFYMTPGSCSTGIHILLEECGLVFEAYIVDLLAGDQYTKDYLAINTKRKLLPDSIEGEVRVLGRRRGGRSSTRALPSSTANWPGESMLPTASASPMQRCSTWNSEPCASAFPCRKTAPRTTAAC